MKKILFVAIILCIISCVCSCGNKTYTEDDLALYDTKTCQLIRLGDSKEQIEKIIGTALTKEQSYNDNNEFMHTSCDYEDSLCIWYNEENEAKNITAYYGFHNNSRYILPEGINSDSTVTEFLKKYQGAKEGGYNGAFYAVLNLAKKKDKEQKYTIDTYTNRDMSIEEYNSFDRTSIEIFYYDYSTISSVGVYSWQ